MGLGGILTMIFALSSFVNNWDRCSARGVKLRGALLELQWGSLGGGGRYCW